MLLLHALAEAVEDTGGNSDELSKVMIQGRFLANVYLVGERRYKLLLTQSDKDTLIRLLDDKELPESQSRHIVENHKYFMEQIKKCGFGLDVLYKGISKLVIVEVALDKSQDNPQLIFESLNSTGLELSQADLIRNYVLMGLAHNLQTELYNDYWHPMERSFGHNEYAALFNRFMRDYLTVRMREIPNMGEVYKAFKRHVQENGKSINDVVADIYRFSKFFVRIALPGKETDPELHDLFADINALRVDVAYPFILELYEDYDQGKLSQYDFCEILQLVISYVFRRSVCGIPTNSLNKTFATISREINKDKYLKRVQVALKLKDSYRRFPDDNEFRQALITKPDMYSMRTRNYLLGKIENYGKKEHVKVENYTIEHIMPQNENLSPEWQAMLGSDWQNIQAKYLHSLGNLTLTGYNLEYSDRSFLEKRDLIDKHGQKVGFAASPLRLNDGLGSIDKWDEAEIMHRSERLANHALGIWSSPFVSADVLAFYLKHREATQSGTYTLADHPYLTGDLLCLFEEFRKRTINLNASVREEILKIYIAYKSTTNFVDIMPYKNRLCLSLRLSLDEVDDPKSLCRDVSETGHHGNGDIECDLYSFDSLDDVMYLVEQALRGQLDE